MSTAEKGLPELRKLVLHLERELRSTTRAARITEEISENSKRLLLSTQDKLEKEVLQHRETEEELRSASLASKAASDAKSRFLATMSHEMRTPLNGVVGVLELLLETPLDDGQRELGQLAQSSARALVVLINRVLEFSTMEAGRLDLRITPLNVRQALEDLIALEAVSAHAKGLKICAVIAPEVPAQLLLDGDRLRQILLNLISNAVKFTHSGEIDLRVGFRTEGESSFLSCEVIDTGVGMSPEDCGYLFEPFTQADSSTTRPVEGTGLGLSISQGLAVLMGGEITVESQLGSGSNFRLVVPSSPAAEVEERTAWAVLKGRTVCVLDSYDAFVDFVRTVVEPLGGQVVRAADEAGARQLAASGDLLALLVDDPSEELLASTPAGVQILATCSEQGSRPPGRPHVLFSGKPLKASRLAEFLVLCLTATPDGSLLPIDRGRRIAPDSLECWSARVLVVDDNESNRSVARLMLERLGCRVEAVSSGLSALGLVQVELFDLVFMDCSMPGLDGYETVRRMGVDGATLGSPTVIAMTAFAMPEDRQRCLDAGMDDYISKPVRLKTIREVLTRHFGPPESSGIDSSSGRAYRRPPEED